MSPYIIWRNYDIVYGHPGALSFSCYHLFNEPGVWFAHPSSWPSGSRVPSPISCVLLLSDPVRQSHLDFRSEIFKNFRGISIKEMNK